MTTQEHFLTIMRERRAWPKGSTDWTYRTRTARRLVWLMRGIATEQWSK
jgi:hypothetical protein